MSSSTPRVRFAPSPTGIMHIGNIRTALLNYLFAYQKNGTFILRIEDTDPLRNFDPGARIILDDLAWLSLAYNEGPIAGGPHAPYFQSERQSLYQKALHELIAQHNVYRCFCSPEDLAKKKDRQQALKLPPRYDRTCLALSQEEIDRFLASKTPFIWRFKVDHDAHIVITDLARGQIHFEMKHFSDFSLTRADGSATFIFANFVDDMLMEITHIFRGEDHQSNTAGQALLYRAFEKPLPIFWHMPMLCNTEGKKLSKRDFGFSLHDLRSAGYLPQAITNYLGITGGSYKEEIMDLSQLAQAFNFDNQHATSQIKYDVEKLRWVNHQWIQKLDPEKLARETLPFLKQAYKEIDTVSSAQLSTMLQIIKTDLYTLKDTVDALAFYFKAPHVSHTEIEACIDAENFAKIKALLINNTEILNDLDQLKSTAKASGLPIKQLFWFVRLALTGHIHGPSIHDLITILGINESTQRIYSLLM